MARIGEDKYRRPDWAPVVDTKNQGVLRSAANMAGVQADRVKNGDNPHKLKASPFKANGANGADDADGSQGGAGTAGAGGGYTQDPYAAQANALYQQLMAREPFKYDLQGDMLYRQYADQYSQMGRQAMMDTMGTAAGLTGGYGNSYASTVGNQAYQQYLGQLNAMVPDFYDRAYQRWQDQGDDLLNQYQLALSRVSGGGGSGTADGDTDEPAVTDNAGAGIPFAQYVASAWPTALQAMQAMTPQTAEPEFDYYNRYLEAYKQRTQPNK